MAGRRGDVSYFAPAGDGTAVETRLECHPALGAGDVPAAPLENPQFPKGRLQPTARWGRFSMNSVKVDGPGGEESTDWQFEVGVDAGPASRS